MDPSDGQPEDSWKEPMKPTTQDIKMKERGRHLAKHGARSTGASKRRIKLRVERGVP